ncbi:MAG TPA: hypothetical protein VH253_14085 [Phycisphaerae bacterium]|nr:hypothetical protein [Phycisphaerae bacterium]
MNTPTLLARAKHLFHHRAARSALVILPLALAAPVKADSLFLLGDNSVSGSISGGSAFGHANSALLSAGQTVQLDGDTIPVATPGSSITAALAAKASFDAMNANIVFDWNGSFSPGSALDPTYNLLLADSIFPKTMPDDAGTLTWTLWTTVYDTDFNVLASQTVSSSDSSTSFLVPVTQAGIPNFWDVQLGLTWSFAMNESNNVINADPSVADAQLDATPSIQLTIIPPAGSSFPPVATPLPAAFWPGASLLTLLASGAFLRNRRSRPLH